MRLPLPPRATAIPLLIAAGIVGLDRALPPPVHKAQDISARVLDRNGVLLRAFTNKSGAWRLPAKPAEVSPLYLRMLLAYEDQRFNRHAGVDLKALGRASWQVLTHGRIVSGGSTLTMQVARLLEPRRRSMLSKLAEIARATQLEARLSKRQILSLYLTIAPYGGNLEGIRAASWAWFGREPRHLTAGQAALLVALPQSPSAIRPDRFPERARAARNKVLKRMVVRGLLTAAEADAAMAEALPTKRRPMPFDAPHLARALHAKAPTASLIRTAIDRRLQRAVQQLMRRELRGLERQSNIAVLVVENATGKIRVWAGSAAFRDSLRKGQVDMVTALRSPGSTLKPFIYGLAFDQRIVHPDTVVRDTPTRFGSYSPENFRRNYYGDVSVRYALQHSLNVPAVAVLDALGPAILASRLKSVGAPLKVAASERGPGLPIALGGAGTTLQDLVKLYVGLANGGIVRPLTVLSRAAPGRGRRLMSRASAWHIARILEGAPPPENWVPARNAKGQRAIAYKTGTSYGFRDAWALGYDGRYTIGVWVGKADGTPSPERYGRNTAAPILFRAFGLLPQKSSRHGAMPVRPADALVVGSARDLPRNLQSFARGVRTGPQLSSSAQRITAAERRPLRVTFPSDGSEVELAPEGDGQARLPLAAEGGKKPLRWIVNGQPVKGSPYRRMAEWRVDGEGFVRILVVDAEGRTARAIVRVR